VVVAADHLEAVRAALAQRGQKLAPVDLGLGQADAAAGRSRQAVSSSSSSAVRRETEALEISRPQSCSVTINSRNVGRANEFRAAEFSDRTALRSRSRQAGTEPSRHHARVAIECIEWTSTIKIGARLSFR